MNRGDIWWADLPVPAGSEPGYRRPVLIVQSDGFNRSKIRTVVCAVITSNTHLAELPGNVLLAQNVSGLSRESVVNISQVITLDRQFLTDHVGSVPNRLMDRVDDGLRLVLGLEHDS